MPLVPTLFCPNCKIYLGPAAEACCSCYWSRPAYEKLTTRGESYWHTQLPGQVVCTPAAVGRRLVLVGWGDRWKSCGVITTGHDPGRPA